MLSPTLYIFDNELPYVFALFFSRLVNFQLFGLLTMSAHIFANTIKYIQEVLGQQPVDVIFSCVVVGLLLSFVNFKVSAR